MLSQGQLLPDRAESGTALHRRVYDRMITAISEGTLAPGQRVPSTRAMAELLSVSRNTVVLAFEQLAADGHLVTIPGSGTFVTDFARDPARAPARDRPAPPPHMPSHAPQPLIRGALNELHLETHKAKALPFRNFYPALNAFPVQIWQRISADIHRQLIGDPDLMGEGDPSGYLALREEIARHMALRGVRCSAQNVIITDGTQQGVDIACRALIAPGDQVWCEDPGYHGIRSSTLAAGAQIVDVPVDAEGMVVAEGRARAPHARLAHVTPGNQAPTGVPMSQQRRLELLDWAHATGAWIIEDDYDGDLRFDGTTMPTLQSLDGNLRVIYMNTFTKTLFPALRLGYAIVPDDLAEVFASVRGLVSRFSPIISQAIVAEFIARGHFARHLKQMRSLYAARHQAIHAAAERHMSRRMTLAPAVSGMQVTARLAPGLCAADITQRAAAAGVLTTPMAVFARTEAPRYQDRLLLGFGEFDARALEEGMRRLGGMLTAMEA